DVSPLQNLTSLTELHLWENEISDVSPLRNLPNLTTLHLGHNAISYLQDQWFNRDIDFKWETKSPFPGDVSGVVMEGNPLEYPPPEIIQEGEEAIQSYLESLKGERLPLNEARVLLVGDGGAGKTSLMKRLLGDPFDEDESQTHGINIREWDIELSSSDGNAEDETFRAHLWDFGGQEIMHATHQFFLSKRSLYIVVLDGRRDEKPEYWLKHVQSFGGQSPVLVLLNKQDENPGHDVERKSLRRKYPNILGFYPLSCRTDDGLAELRRVIEDTLADLDMRRTPFAENWGNVKSQLADIGEDYIHLDGFKGICCEEGITDHHAQQTLLSFLDRLGIVLYFEDFELPDTQVLKPEWLTNAVYDVINAPIVAENNGELPLSAVSSILDCPPEEQRFVIGMMKKFELCYEVDDERVLIPDLLPKQEPNHPFDLSEPSHYYIEYDFLPPSLLPRFTVQSYREIEVPWRSGVLLRDPTFNAEALITADEADRRISIWVDGDRKREYFATLRKRLRDLHADFEELGEVEWVPLPKDPEYAVEYEELLGLEQMGESSYTHGKTRERYRVAELLNGVIKPEDREVQDAEPEDREIHMHVEQRQDVQQTSEQRQTSVQKTNISVEVKNENVQHFSGTLSLLREDFRDAIGDEQKRDRIENELDRVEGALKQIEEEGDPEQAKRSAAVKRLKAFVENLGDKGTQIGNAIQTIDNGIKHAQNLAKYYNSIAQWCGWPQVPKPLL
ncbi:COR domain-containing protein, partial [Salinibacter altiplanensis]|uniref:COR domain-containing protein n=1 Tax=Salinibacter altiplanensis TaxID=1803181 RepID=UPI0018F86DEC